MVSENFCILIQISLKFVLNGSIDSMQTLFQLIAEQATRHYLSRYNILYENSCILIQILSHLFLMVQLTTCANRNQLSLFIQWNAFPCRNFAKFIFWMAKCHNWFQKANWYQKQLQERYNNDNGTPIPCICVRNRRFDQKYNNVALFFVHWLKSEKLGKYGVDNTNTLRWRDSVSNHQPHDCLPSRLFRRRSKKTSKLRVTDLFVGNSLGTGEFPAQMASNAENVSIWWRHHETEIGSRDTNEQPVCIKHNLSIRVELNIIRNMMAYWANYINSGNLQPPVRNPVISDIWGPISVTKPQGTRLCWGQ